MSAQADKLLESIPELVSKQDATSLVAVRDHEDKRVRKAARKALHTLKSKGVEIPDAAPTGWTVGSTLSDLRGPLEAVAIVDTRAIPGAMRFMLSIPDTDTGSTLFAGALGSGDRVLDFSSYKQSDGQRVRMVRDWDRKVGERRIPVEWLMQRIRFARDATVAAGVSVPQALDQVLTRLGDAPKERPTSFLTGLDDQPAFEADKDINDMLQKAGVPNWPPLLDLESTLGRAAEIHGDKPQPTEDDARVELLMKSIAGDEGVREGLKGALAQGLSDAAIHLWLEGDVSAARKLSDMVSALVDNDEPETMEWVARLLGFQVASLLRVVQQQQAQEEQRARRGQPRRA